MKSLGWMNGWKDNDPPEEYKRCVELNHRIKRAVNHTRCLTIECCEICKIYWMIDSGD
jgi:hypothetical protein